MLTSILNTRMSRNSLALASNWFSVIDRVRKWAISEGKKRGRNQRQNQIKSISERVGEISAPLMPRRFQMLWIVKRRPRRTRLLDRAENSCLTKLRQHALKAVCCWGRSQQIDCGTAWDDEAGTFIPASWQVNIHLKDRPDGVNDVSSWRGVICGVK